MNQLIKVANFIDHLNEKAGIFTGWLTVVLVLLVCYDVFTRYLLQSSSTGVQELEWHLFAVIFLIAAAYTLKHDKHVRVDILYIKLSPAKKAWINFFGSIIFLIPFSILIIYTSKDFVINSFLIGETSPDPGGLPARYILKACIPLAFLLLLLQGVSLAIKSFNDARHETQDARGEM